MDKQLILEKNKKKIENFLKILEQTKNIDEKKKSLWMEIYFNAQEDRERASLLLSSAMSSMGGDQNTHSNIGTVMSKYLERMSKSNDQILKLAEMIQVFGSKSEPEELDEEDIYSKLAGSNGI